jgi:hypothetical protein
LCCSSCSSVSGSTIIPSVELLSPTTSADGNEEDQTYSEAAEAVEVAEVAPEDVSNSVPELDSSSFAASLDDGGLVDDAGDDEVVIGILRPAAAAAAACMQQTGGGGRWGEETIHNSLGLGAHPSGKTGSR